MNETEFLAAAELELEKLADKLESAFDVDCTISGNVLTVELDSGAQVVVNTQTPMKEIWLASHLGGLHFALTDGRWTSTRTGETLLAAAERAVKSLGG